MEEGNFNSTEQRQAKTGKPRTNEEEMNDLHGKNKFSCSASCPFSKQEYSNSDAAQRSKTSIKLCGLIVFYTIVMIIEIIGGLKANSLAVLTDAAHFLSDIAGFFISLSAVWVSGWQATPKQSFGFNRLEVIGALLSVQLIRLISVTLLYEAIRRLITKQKNVNGELMLGIAAFGFVVNLVLVLWLGHDHPQNRCQKDSHDLEESDEENIKLVSTPHEKTEMSNINIQGAYLHLVTDLVCTLVFSTIAMATTLPMLKNVSYVLMERMLNDIDAAHLQMIFDICVILQK